MGQPDHAAHETHAARLAHEVEDGARRERIATILALGIEEQRRTYDPQRHLVGNRAPWAGGKAVFRPPMSLWLAHALLHQAAGGSGGTDDAREAALIVSAVLDSQERTPTHPHRGNFLWLADDEEVVDLNAVQFMLRALLPLLVDYGDRLPAELVVRARDVLRLALEEQERLDVAPTYTNIHVMSLFALLVGAEWLDDPHFLALGRARWDAWVAFTAGSGAPHEYNSPGYGATDLSALAALHQYVRDERVKLQARLFYERLWLHLVLHFHRPTGLHAGPHCRCYWHMMAGGHAGVHDMLWRETGRTFIPEEEPAGAAGAGRRARVPASAELALTAHWLPAAARAWIEHQLGALPAEVRETANRAEGADLTTYLAPAYALGTASCTYSIGQDDFYIEHQANHLLLQYARPPGPGDRSQSTSVPGTGDAAGGPAGGADSGHAAWGMLYSRYVVNDQHYGTLRAAPDRPPNAFYDQGNFAGVQLRNKAIAVYALQPQHEEVSSLKTVVAIRLAPGRAAGSDAASGAASESEGGAANGQDRALALDEVWVGGRRVAAAELPLDVTSGEWLVIGDGAVYVGVRPLEPSCLGRETPIVLEHGPDGELWLTSYNYRGPAKRFWDYASLRGAFWRGNLRAGYIVEVASRDEYGSAAAFHDHLRAASVRDETAPAAGSPLVRTVAYRSGGDEIELRYDLWHTRPLDRRINGALYHPPALESPVACQGSGGELRAGSALLRVDAQPAWLLAQELDPASRAWSAVNPQDAPTPLRLETPLGTVTAARWGVGRIEWRAPEGGAQTLVVDTLEEPVELRVPDGVRVVRTGPATQPGGAASAGTTTG